MEIVYGFYGPYFMGKSLGTFKILIFGLWSFIPHPYLWCNRGSIVQLIKQL